MPAEARRQSALFELACPLWVIRDRPSLRQFRPMSVMRR